MMFHSFCRFALIAIGFCAFQAEGARAESLSDAIAAALKNHPRIEAARADLAFAREEKDEQLTGYFPQVSLNAAGGRLFGDNATSRGSVTSRGTAYSYTWEAGVTARQRLFDGFETENKWESAEAREQSAQLTLLDTKDILIAETALAYIELMRTRTLLSMLYGYEKKVEDYLGRIQLMVDQGGADESDLQQARDITLILDGLIYDYQAQTQRAESSFQQLTGYVPKQDLQPAPNMSPSLPASVEQAVAHAMDHNPAIQAAMLNVQSLEHDARAERAKIYPDLNGEVSYFESDRVEELGGEVVDARALLRMNWDIDTSGAAFSRVDKIRNKYKAAKARLNDFERQLARDIKMAWTDYEAAQKQHANQQKRVEMNEILFNTFNAQFEGARIRLLQLMQADNQRFTTSLEAVNAEYRLLSAQYNLAGLMSKLKDVLNLEVANDVKTVSAVPMGEPSHKDSEFKPVMTNQQKTASIETFDEPVSEPPSKPEPKPDRPAFQRLTGYDTRP